ncbi:MAG: pyruvate, phosphate dikinase [Treponema sp.]|jgi:pyruvate,orthophosphate dikinase|nr:pyruvate, phosphate dikinase [Treponema sp.]
MAKQKLKNVYFFGEGNIEGNAEMKDTLGGKGANLAEMSRLGIPVPPGFTISTEVCAAYYENKKKYPEGLEKDVAANLKRLEKLMGKRLGDPKDPLLVSVRSGAPVSMPGMMDTILNLGINDRAVEGLAKKTGNLRFAWDAYRRFIQMYGSVVMEVPHDSFEAAIKRIKEERGARLDTDLDADDLRRLVEEYKEIVREGTGKDFPQDPQDQLWGAIGAVFSSWNNERAIKYRQINEIKNVKGTAVNVQSMVFGNMGENSGTGVCFSRDPSTGENIFYGEYLMNAQGEDVVAGIRTPEKIATLEQRNKKIYDQLLKIRNKLEKHFRDMQDMEFTVQEGKLFLLQTRNGKRTGAAAIKIAVDMVNEKLIAQKTAIMRVTPDLLDQALHPRIEANALKEARPLAKGIDASPGAGCGRIVFSAQDAENWHENGEKALLVRQETSPEDIGGMVVSQGILTSTGGKTSHAAVVARGLGVPCIVGAKDVVIQGDQVVIGEKTLREGDWITIDGSTGYVYEGQLPLVKPEISDEMKTFLLWCDNVRAGVVRGGIKGFEVRANADQPEDAKRAFNFGAQGVGLCRTEHMFFDKEKLIHFRAMIVADSLEERKEALKKILSLQQEDFYGIFKTMAGRPVTIRLLDPPLHEFVPHTGEETQELADHLGVSIETLQPKIDRLKEQNPMLGHRGCRLAVTYPEIYDMQVEAIARAAVQCLKETVPVQPEIMIPIVVTARELKLLRPCAEAILKRVFDEEGVQVPVKIGTMIEVPRAAIRSAHIAQYADFFSFGTNDLTQMTFAFSRDDVAAFLPEYLEKNVLDVDPFKSIDEEGVGFLIRHATEQGRGVKPNLKIGICGEHGGDPKTIDFCYRAGLSYVSCSPFRVPLARLSAAQAVLNNPDIGDEEAAVKAPASPSTPKKRGRPARAQAADFVAPVAKKRGRPARTKVEAPAVETAPPVAPVAQKRRGRPARAKVEAPAVETTAPAAPKKRGRPRK